jgi:hypothetical protein
MVESKGFPTSQTVHKEMRLKAAFPISPVGLQDARLPLMPQRSIDEQRGRDRPRINQSGKGSQKFREYMKISPLDRGTPIVQPLV